jgi:hypothetical protein
MNKHDALYFLAFAACACGVADTDSSFWQQTKDLGGKQFQVMPGVAPPEGAGGEPAVGAGGMTNPTPTTMPTTPVPGAGGMMNPNPIPTSSGGAPPFGAGGAGGMFVFGNGGMVIMPGAGGMMPGTGGMMMGMGGMIGGNSGKCTFTFNATTVTARGTYAPRNVGGIWITDSSNKFVKTLRIWGSIRLNNATAWVQASGNNRVDAVTGGTRTSHGPIDAKWDCTDVSHNAVPDGSYVAHITFTESDANPFFGSTPIQTTANFTKSTAGADGSGMDTANFTGTHVKLTVP